MQSQRLMMSTRTDCLRFIKNNTLIGIKAGTDRPHFLNIWMVVVNNRIFARSWGFAEKSWFNSFLYDPAGFIRCDDKEYKIKAVVPSDLNQLTRLINKAYLEKYDTGGKNSYYATRIVKEKHQEKTMEFILISD